MNIVILEDEAIMAMFLKDTLEKRGHDVKAMFSNANRIFEFIKKEKIDLIFVDIMIKGEIDGIKVAKKLREEDNNIKIVFITSYKDTQTIQEAKESKPNGYLIKPITQEHLDAILMVCESTIEEKPKEKNKLYIADYIFDKKTKILRNNKKIISLSDKEIICFEILLKNYDTYVSRETLINATWEEINDETKKSLRELISRLRRKLNKLKINNMTNIGYTLTEK